MLKPFGRQPRLDRFNRFNQSETSFMTQESGTSNTSRKGWRSDTQVAKTPAPSSSVEVVQQAKSSTFSSISRLNPLSAIRKWTGQKEGQREGDDEGGNSFTISAEASTIEAPENPEPQPSPSATTTEQGEELSAASHASTPLVDASLPDFDHSTLPSASVLEGDTPVTVAPVPAMEVVSEHRTSSPGPSAAPVPKDNTASTHDVSITSQSAEAEGTEPVQSVAAVASEHHLVESEVAQSGDLQPSESAPDAPVEKDNKGKGKEQPTGTMVGRDMDRIPFSRIDAATKGEDARSGHSYRMEAGSHMSLKRRANAVGQNIQNKYDKTKKFITGKGKDDDLETDRREAKKALWGVECSKMTEETVNSFRRIFSVNTSALPQPQPRMRWSTFREALVAVGFQMGQAARGSQVAFSIPPGDLEGLKGPTLRFDQPHGRDGDLISKTVLPKWGKRIKDDYPEFGEAFEEFQANGH